MIFIYHRVSLWLSSLTCFDNNAKFLEGFIDVIYVTEHENWMPPTEQILVRLS